MEGGNTALNERILSPNKRSISIVKSIDVNNALSSIHYTRPMYTQYTFIHPQ